MKIAIVGGSYHNWKNFKNAEQTIKLIIEGLLINATEFISGGCGGVDVWSEQVAKSKGIKCVIFKPEVMQWEDKDGKKGYKTRNNEIANYADIIYCIEPEGRIHSGGLYTYNKALELKKECKAVFIQG